MMRNLRTAMSFMMVGLVLVFVSCGKDNPTEPKVNPPTFSVASINVVCDDGSDCIQFSARPDKDVEVVKVVIMPPVGNAIIFNLGSATVVAGEDFLLQDPQTAYFRISGGWKFVFTGNLATGDKSSFDVTVTVNVSA